MRRSSLATAVRSLTLFASVAAPCYAQAADLLPPLPPEPLPVEVGGGWYLRGDIGVGATEISRITTSRADGYMPKGYRVEQKSISESYFAGGGVGYQFNAFLRGDVTAEFRGGGRLSFTDSADTYRTFDGKTFFPTFDDGKGQETTYDTGKPYKSLDSYNAHLSSVVVMANGYIDLGTWYGVTPYVGGGIGSAFHRVSGFSDFGAGSSAGGFGVAAEKHFTNLAWNVQAGLAYSVTSNVKLELGYRYMNLGDGKLGTIKCFNSGCDLPYSYSAKDITSHDVKIGMRWYLGGGVIAPVAEYQPEPAPLVRKY